MKVLPIPIVGALPLEAMEHFFLRHHSRTVKGFYVAFLTGLTADSAVSGNATFTISAQAIKSIPGSTPLLLRLRAASKDSARIVRTTKATLKITGSQINPATQEVHETEQTVINCRSESRANGDVLLTFDSVLPAGEYAIVLAPPFPKRHQTTPQTRCDFGTSGSRGEAQGLRGGGATRAPPPAGES
jgi:hypothetical protein